MSELDQKLNLQLSFLFDYKTKIEKKINDHMVDIQSKKEESWRLEIELECLKENINNTFDKQKAISELNNKNDKLENLKREFNSLLLKKFTEEEMMLEILSKKIENMSPDPEDFET